MLYKASSPGSLMVLGEYAVLENYPAMVAGINKRLTVLLSPRKDQKIEIISALGKYETTLKNFDIVPPFTFVLSAIKKYDLSHGMTLIIESEFLDTVGFASSAAVSVATIAVLSLWLGYDFSALQIIQEATEIVRQVQGVGSGADVAACVLGGFVHYQKEPLIAERLASTYPLSVIYSGYKTKTMNAIARVKANFSSSPRLYARLMEQIGDGVKEGLLHAKNKNWDALGKIMNIQQGLMDTLGVNTKELNQIIENLRLDLNVLGAKISGSGFGDCVIGLGSPSDSYFRGNDRELWLDVNVGTEGLRYEKI